MTFGQLAKYTSHMYKNLTPDEKATWENRAAQDKARFDAEIAVYVPPPGHDSRGVLIEDRNHAKNSRKRSKKVPHDPNAPKRPSGAYVFLTNELRPKILAENPGIKFIELGKLLGERWRSLTPDEKKRYENLAAQDKIRFQREMEEYTAKQAAAAAAAATGAPGVHHHGQVAVPQPYHQPVANGMPPHVPQPQDTTSYYTQPPVTHGDPTQMGGYPAPFPTHDPYAAHAFPTTT